MMQSTQPAAPPMWLPYVTVADCDATALRAGQLGGQTLLGATDVPGVGRFAILLDPVGAAFAVMAPAPRAA
jgi:predicted enzyme related to lactoylglutathione lyase